MEQISIFFIFKIAVGCITIAFGIFQIILGIIILVKLRKEERLMSIVKRILEKMKEKIKMRMIYEKRVLYEERVFYIGVLKMLLLGFGIFILPFLIGLIVQLFK